MDPSDLSPVAELPASLDPWRAVDQSRCYQGTIELTRFPRLRPLLVDDKGSISFSLRFTRDDARRPVVQVGVQGELGICCQRCLGSMDWPVDAQAELMLVQGLDEVSRMPSQYDPLFLTEDRVDPLALLEDELLLAIPDIPRHLGDECPVFLATGGGEDGAGSKNPHEAEVADSPFAVLADLKSRGD